MNNSEHKTNKVSSRAAWFFWFIGLGSLSWLLLRSVAKPRRLSYPCQQAALWNSLGFLSYLISMLGFTQFYRRFRRRTTAFGFVSMGLMLLVLVGITGSIATPSEGVWASPTLPAWTSPGAVSDVFAVTEVPVPSCSLAGGSLPASPPCNDPAYALPDEGIDHLISLMEEEGIYFYKTDVRPTGVVGSDDVVVIKVNTQAEDGDGTGRFTTNTDVLKGLIWEILQHPDGFDGEVVVAENTQRRINWEFTPTNAEDQEQSFQDVVDVFQSLGYPVSLYAWTGLNDTLIHGGSVSDSGYPAGEYIRGNTSDAYILLDDPLDPATNELAYPKFQTTGGNYVSMRYGIWNGVSYDADRLTFINLPVLKAHGSAGATISWKNLVGLITISDFDLRFAGGQRMHDYFYRSDPGYGLLGREMALVTNPDLHIVDAIWVPYQNNSSGAAIRQDVLLASTDPFALDWYASEYLLLPLAGRQHSSAARSGLFRTGTRLNQNSAEFLWPSARGAYPYMDLLDSYDGDVPSDDEKNQLNVYVNNSVVEEDSPDLGGSLMTASAARATPGEAVTYTITLKNSGALSNATAVMTNSIPTGLNYVPGTLTTTFGAVDDSEISTLYWLGVLTPCKEITITYQITTSDVTGNVVNQAALASPAFDPMMLSAPLFLVGSSSCTTHLPVIVKE